MDHSRSRIENLCLMDIIQYYTTAYPGLHSLKHRVVWHLRETWIYVPHGAWSPMDSVAVFNGCLEANWLEPRPGAGRSRPGDSHAFCRSLLTRGEHNLHYISAGTFGSARITTISNQRRSLWPRTAGQCLPYKGQGREVCLKRRVVSEHNTLHQRAELLWYSQNYMLKGPF